MNFSLFLFILFPLSPTFLISISGNLMMLLNMWVVLDCFVKIDHKCLFFSDTSPSLICDILSQFVWMHELTHYFLNYLHCGTLFILFFYFVKLAWCYWLYKKCHEFLSVAAANFSCNTEEACFKWRYHRPESCLL